MYSFTGLLDTSMRKSIYIFLVQLILFVDGHFEHLKVRKRGFRKNYKKLSQKFI